MVMIYTPPSGNYNQNMYQSTLVSNGIVSSEWIVMM